MSPPITDIFRDMDVTSSFLLVNIIIIKNFAVGFCNNVGFLIL